MSDGMRRQRRLSAPLRCRVPQATPRRRPSRRLWRGPAPARRTRRGAARPRQGSARAGASSARRRGRPPRPAAVAASERQRPSKFVGVYWDKCKRKWKAQITHDGKKQHLGSFDDEQEAARAVDTAARRLRSEDAHGGRASKTGRRWKLNFPTEVEVKRAQERGAAAPTIHGSDSRTQLRGVTEEGKAKRRDSSQGKRSSSKRQRTGLLLPPSRYANTVCFSHLYV
jgi:hypothetical protein